MPSMSIIKKTVATILMTLGITETSMATETQEKAINAYNFSFTNSDGTPLKLSQYKGKVLLIVNTASKCGFTPQYAGLEALWEKYKEKGLVVIAVPSNDFGTQEPGSNQEIRQFCEANYNISFPVVNKEHVK
jgi:glutathione peroxidase